VIEFFKYFWCPRLYRSWEWHSYY